MAASRRGVRCRQSQPGRPRTHCRRRFYSQHFRDLPRDRANLRAPVLSACDAGEFDGLRDAAAAFADVAAHQPSDFEALETANRDFHAIILEGEFNVPAIETMERYAGIINATRAKLPVTLSRLRQRATQHREIVDAIAAGDANRAVRAAIEHIRGAGEDLLNLMRQARMVGVRHARPTEPSAHGAGRATAESTP